MKAVRFTVPGEPQGKGRPRFSRFGPVRTFTPDKTAVYENLIKLEYQAQAGGARFPDGAVLGISVTAYYAIPKRASRKARQQMLAGLILPTKKPDWDNIGKAVADALNGIAYHDDAQIAEGTVRKAYGDEPRLEVEIFDIIEKREEEAQHEDN